ncbi:SAM-dependent methyltransferase [Salinigranum rubrum]|uniref:SAM-dependent methyltransferase n=1 Tax=Salinigranum rubrum TaxID=755307 RepID=A0A2I8VHJ8_9EURY|nr:class I SAM-dependent methyltransferase [Salinigranum rubrum]AUV81364.1 SAM-dependent methyltransferase [Salinigranum rubrum]
MDGDAAEGGNVVNTMRTYDRIATHFAATREYAWPEVETFLAERRGALALDVGCGNGRHTELLADHAERVVGLDVSRGLLGEARARATDRGFDAAFLQGDAAALPLQTETVDLAVYVAAVHHLTPRARRVASLDELARVLTRGGRGLVSAWSTTHDRFAEQESDRGFDTTVDWTLPGGETVPRFYHIYAPAEFEADLDASALVVHDVFVSSGNCYAVVGTDGHRG